MCTLTQMIGGLRVRSSNGSASASASRTRQPGRAVRRVLATFAAATVLALTPAAASADNGLLAWPHDNVYVVDSTSARWPVGQAAETLDNHSPLNLIWTDHCPRGPQCIYVREGRLSGDRVGKTTVDSRGHRIVAAHVTLDHTFGYALSFHDRLAAACHELEHAVGMLNHSPSKASCRYAVISGRMSSHPSTADYRWLRRAY